jgi:predicted nuclease of predicted toxin-antitoxin system
MRLLLDECVPKRLKRELPGHEVKTVQDMRWAGIKNGDLLKLANGQFDALLTVDQGIEYQQILSGLTISIVVMLAASNDVDDLRPLLPGVEQALADLRNGEVRRVGG